MVAAQEAVDHDAAPIAQQIALAKTNVRDLDDRIVQLDAMVNTATGRGWTKAAMALVGTDRLGAALVAERQHAAERLADVKVQQVGMEAQRARITAEAGAALYLAELFGSDDTEGMVRLITTRRPWCA